MEIPNDVKRIAEILDSKKADDIVILHVTDLTIIADYFVVASASNVNHVRTLSEEVQNKMAESGRTPRRTEGESENLWVVLDYEDVLVHIFQSKERDYYQLERLWKVDGNYIDYSKEKRGESDE